MLNLYTSANFALALKNYLTKTIMNQRFYLLLLFWAILTVQSFGQTTITVQDDDLMENTVYNWTKDNAYVLDGLVYLEAGGTLNIEAGTVIKGISVPTTGDNTSALIITRGAQIFAEGTSTEPIIFTAEVDDPADGSDLPDPQEAQGLWGGLIILGEATIARPNGEDGIEGIDANETRARYGGGANPNDNDNSGILRYVSIRHGGAPLAPNDEINGLSLGGVGAGTTLEYIEIFANFDDGIEFFGGTVDLKYATVAFCGDDAFDYDFGWRGKGQFWFAIQDDGPASAGRAGEHDGANPDGLNPFSQPTIYNATYIGSGVNSVEAPDGEGNDFAFVFRDRAGGFYWNSIFTDFYDKAITIEDLAGDDNDTYANFLNGALALKNNIWFGFGAGSDLAGLVQLGEDNTSGDVSTLVATLAADGNTLTDPTLAGISRMADGGLDPRPNANSPALTAENLPTDPFFSPVGYKGAFGNGDNWLLDWTALDANGFLGDLVTPVVGQTITIQDDDLVGNTTYTWTAENTYILDGLVYLEEGGKLNIEAGTVIKGITVPTTGDNTSALIITRGAQIYAVGTAQAPVIFTAEFDDPYDATDIPDPQEAQGFWGGLIILGKATIARPGGEDGIEGIDANETRARYGGGDAPVDDDNSGILRYVSIRHGGAPLAPNDEINGLSLGGVGSGTTLEYIEIFANFDDGIEFFGGTVDLKYATVAFCGDDAFDYDFGWSGRGQFWFAIQDDGPASAGRAGEHDGANPDGLDPFSQPTIYNATYIGSGANSPEPPDGEGNDYAFVFRDRAGGYYWNSVFTDFYGKAITIEDLANDDNDTYANFLNGDLALKNNIWFGFGGGTDLAGLVQLGEDNTTGDVSTLVATLASDGNQLADPLLGGISRVGDHGLDPRPGMASPALTGAISPTDDYFAPVDYLGAFDPTKPLWLLGWTALDVNQFLGALVSSTYERVKEEKGITFEAPIPTPANDQASIRMSLVEAARINMYVVDLNGRIVRREMNNQLFGTGDYLHTMNVSNLATGTYFVVLQAGKTQIVHKLIIAR